MIPKPARPIVYWSAIVVAVILLVLIGKGWGGDVQALAFLAVVAGALAGIAS